MACLTHSLVGGLVLLSSCSMREGAAGPAPVSPVSDSVAASVPEAAPTPVGPVIGTLKRRNDALVITASGHGPVFIVRGKAGQVVAQGISREELRRRFEELHQAYETGVASDVGAPLLDARVEPCLTGGLEREPERRR